MFPYHLTAKESEKIEKYQDLKCEITMWAIRKVEVIPAVVGSLGAIPKCLNNSLQNIGVRVR